MNNMLEFGPQVAIVDDTENDIKDLKRLLNELNIGYKFFLADPIESYYPEHPIESIKLLFLDLYFTKGMDELDPYKPVQWVQKIIPDSKDYSLVILTMDTHDAGKVIDLLYHINKAPTYCIVQQKNVKDLDIKSLLEKVECQDRQNSIIEEFYGEIIDIEKDHVLINCLLDKKMAVTQIRRFDLLPFKNKVELSIGNFILLKIMTKPGSRLFEFYNIHEDISELFNKKNPFEGLEGTPFFNFSE